MFFTVPFRDKTFYGTTTASATPLYNQQSFLQLEREMREQWWTIEEGDVVVDVGAAYGSYTLSALVQGAGKVIFFEPSKTEFFDACSNVLINSWMNKCVPLNCLAGEEAGIRDYYQDSHSYRKEGEKDSRIVLTLDKVLESYSPERFNWLKIDVEGAEAEVLKGGLKSIEKHHPKILVENHVGFVPGVDKIVEGILRPLGYSKLQYRSGQGINDNWILWGIK